MSAAEINLKLRAKFAFKSQFLVVFSYELSALSFRQSEMRRPGLLYQSYSNIKNTMGLAITLHVDIVLKSFVSKVQSAY